MKLLLVICPEERQETLRELIVKHDVHAYTELRDAIGEGLTGRKLGTHTWPGTSVIVLTVVSDEKKDELMAALRECKQSLFPGESVRAFVMPVEEEL
jgi:hypothetical protein